MTVYVDSMRAKYGRLILCHMIADTEAELHAMADRIGVARQWFQRDASTPHYDICLSKRAVAVRHGAVVLTRRELGLKLRELRSKSSGDTGGVQSCK